MCEEGDAHVNFKKVLAGAKPEDIVEFMSVAGLPARAVKTVWLERYLRREHVLQAEAAAFEESHKGQPVDRVAKCSGALMCLSVCGLRDGIPKIGQFCIDTQLAAALRGDLSRGLFFRGASSVPFGAAIRPVRELIDYMLTGRMPAALVGSGRGALTHSSPVGIPIILLKPQSTWVISAVTPAARSDSRNAATLPTSSIVTLRRSGAVLSTTEKIFEKPLMPAAASVLIGPAEMPLTRMPRGPRLAAR